MLGLTGPPPRVPSPLNLDAVHFLAFVEGLLTENSDEAREIIDRLYREAEPRKKQSREDRARDIARFTDRVS